MTALLRRTPTWSHASAVPSRIGGELPSPIGALRHPFPENAHRMRTWKTLALVLACLTGAGTLAAQEKAMRAADAKAEADDRIADKPHEKLLKDHLAKVAEHERVRGAGLDEVHMQLEQHHKRIEKIHSDLLKRHLLLAAEHRAVEKAHDRSSDSARMVSDHERMTSEHSQSANDHPRLESDHELMSAEHEGMLRDHLALPKGAVAAGTGARNADAKSAARKKP